MSKEHHKIHRYTLVLGLAALMLTSVCSRGAILVDLDATGLDLGPLQTWINNEDNAGEPGDFIASDVVPEVTTVEGVNGVTFNGTDHYYTGPPSSYLVVGDLDRTIEAWIYNPEIADEETIISWGHRGGPDGSNLSFNHGANATFGAVGHWGEGPDVGWNGNIVAGQWTYVVYTYDSFIYTASVYKDGVLANSEDVGTLITHEYYNDDGVNLIPYRVAAQNDGDQTATAPLRGSMTIARIRVHDVPLSEQEILAKFIEEAPTFGLDDADGDGMPNAYENRYDFLNPFDASDADLDEDQDGLANLAEYERGTAPDNPDTDADGVNDGAEVNRMAGGLPAPTDPLRPDTDNDELNDGVETDTGTYVSETDTGTDPLVADTDADTYSDGEEVLKGSDPNVASSVPGVSDQPLVSLDAAQLPLGPLPEWANDGFLGGSFQSTPDVPEVTVVQGVQSVGFNGTSQFYTGPPSPVWVTGDGACTVEAWVNNPVAADEETIFSWGRRGGPDGSNMSFNHGMNATYGAVGHWGTPDMGWEGTVSEGQWTYVVYTYDPTSGFGTIYKDGQYVIEELFADPLAVWALDSTPNEGRLPFRIASQNEGNGAPTEGLRGSMHIARLRVHDRTFSDADVLDTFNTEADEFGAVDYDNDGIPTWYEREYAFLDENNAADAAQDEDSDALTNLGEYENGTKPDDPDTDGDLAEDGAEVNQIFTHPLVTDTDQDGLWDGVESATGSYVSPQDTGTQPLTFDTDADSYVDGHEVMRGSDPNVAGSVPDLQSSLAIVDLDATTLSTGPLPEWANEGAMGGAFVADGPVPEVSMVQGAKGVSLDGVEQFYTGPISPLFVTGGGARTVEAWILNPEIADEETILAWGRRGGGDYTSMSFGHGLNGTWGAVGHWGAPDIGWSGTTVEGAWTHVAYTYDDVSTTGTVYTDGQLATEEIFTAPLDTWAVDSTAEALPLPFRLGAQNEANGSPTAGLRGSMTYSRVRVYDTALTSGEIQTNYDSEKADYEMPVTPALDVSVEPNGDITLTFEGVLESADGVLGPWTEETGSGSITVTPSEAMKVYRAKQ